MTKISQFLLLPLLAAGLHASPIVYMVTQGVNPPNNGASCPDGPCGSRIAELDVATGLATNFSPNLSPYNATNEEIFDIALSAANEIYGVTAASLYRIDRLTGLMTHLGLTGVANLNALAFDSSGILYATSFGSNNLYTVNTGTGAATSVGNWSQAFQSAGDIAFVGSRLFLATTTGQIAELNNTVADPNRGSVISLSAIGLGGAGAGYGGLKGLAEAGGSLYLASAVLAGNIDYRIGLVNIEAINFGNVVSSVAISPFGGTSGFVAGLTGFAEVPEPSVITLSLLGFGMIAWGRRKARTAK